MDASQLFGPILQCPARIVVSASQSSIPWASSSEVSSLNARPLMQAKLHEGSSHCPTPLKPYSMRLKRLRCVRSTGAKDVATSSGEEESGDESSRETATATTASDGIDSLAEQYEGQPLRHAAPNRSRSTGQPPGWLCVCFHTLKQHHDKLSRFLYRYGILSKR